MNLEIIAHRGFSAIAPENTLAAFELAIAYGTHSIEFDLQLSADGVPVVFHDASLERITGTANPVRETTLQDLQKLDAGVWFSDRFTGEKIPTLKEALGILKQVPKFLYFDVKPHCQWSDAQVEDLVKILQSEKVLEKCVITSFNPQFLDRVRQVSQELAIGHIVANEEAYLNQLGKAVAEGDHLISSQYQLLLNHPLLIDKSRSQGVDVVAWTVDSREDLQKLIDVGVMRIVTNSLLSEG